MIITKDFKSIDEKNILLTNVKNYFCMFFLRRDDKAAQQAASLETISNL